MVAATRKRTLGWIRSLTAIVTPIAEKAIIAAGLDDRIDTASGDFFTDSLPRADVVTMGNIRMTGTWTGSCS
jgi:hypothetical protein